MITNEWYWKKEFNGCVPREERAIVTLAKAGLIFSPNEDGTANLNHLQESLKTYEEDYKHRSITVEITIKDEEVN